MRGDIAVVLLFAAAVFATADHTSDFDKIDDRLDHVTARLVKLEDRIAARVDPARVQRAKSLVAKVVKLEGDGCDSNDFQCGGNDPQCVGNLLVCDGVKDCRNGADEAQCKPPFQAGDVFEGHVIYDRCTQRQPDIMNFEISAVQTSANFGASAKVRGNLVMEYDDQINDGQASLPSVGQYLFATNKLVFRPQESDRLGLSCEFDGSNTERCVGAIKRDSGVQCAKIIFTKKQ
jgi:hypothetical protein